MRALSRTLRCRAAGAALGLAALVAAPAQVIGGESSSLSTSMFGDEREALWPIDVEVEIVPVGLDDDEQVTRRVTIVDGQWTTFEHAMRTPVGFDTFELELTAHHHPRGAVELEYDLAVRELPYQRTSLRGYVMHRLALGPAPTLGRPALRAARADIVSTAGAPVRTAVEIDDRRYELRLRAARSRG